VTVSNGSSALTRPTLTIVIPSHNGGELTVACLERVLPQVRDGDRVIVVDNGSWDGTTRTIGTTFGEAVAMVTRRQAMGFARACNLGASQAATDAVVFLNQDLFVAPDVVDCLRESARCHPEAILGAVLFGPEGTTLQHAGGTILPNAITRHPHRGLSSDCLDRQGFLPSDYVSGALLLVSVATFRALGGFDVRFGPAYFEETDFCVRARAIGMPSLVALSVTARHLEATVAGRDTPRYHFLYHRNRLRFVMKHYTRHAMRTMFLPAEHTWLRSSLPALTRRSVRHAYAAALLELPRWLLERRRRPPSFVP